MDKAPDIPESSDETCLALFQGDIPDCLAPLLDYLIRGFRRLVEISADIQKLVTEQQKHPTTLPEYRRTVESIELLIRDYAVEWSELAGYYSTNEILYLPMRRTQTVEWEKRGREVLSTQDFVTTGTGFGIMREDQVADLVTAVPRKFVELATGRLPASGFTHLDVDGHAPGEDFEDHLIQAFIALLSEIEEMLYEGPQLGIIGTRYQFEIDDDGKQQAAKRILGKVGRSLEEFPRMRDLLELKDSLAYQESFLAQGREPSGDTPVAEPVDAVTVMQDIGDRALAVMDEKSALVRNGQRQVLEVIEAVAPPYIEYTLGHAERIRNDLTISDDEVGLRAFNADSVEQTVGWHRKFLVDQFHDAAHPIIACSLFKTIIKSFHDAQGIFDIFKYFFIRCDDPETSEAIWCELQNHGAILTNELLAVIVQHTASKSAAKAAIAAYEARGLNTEDILAKRARSLASHTEFKSQEDRDRNYKKIRFLAWELANGHYDGTYIDNTVARITACADSEEAARKILVNVLLRTNSFTALYLWSRHIIESQMSDEELTAVTTRFHPWHEFSLDEIFQEACAEMERRKPKTPKRRRPR